MVDRLEHERGPDPEAPSAGSVVEYVQWLMDRDHKSTPLKELQGLIRKRVTRWGSRRSRFPTSRARWNGGVGRARGRHLFFRQRPRAALLFSHSTAGDLTLDRAGISTATIGSRGNPAASHRRIGETMNVASPTRHVVHLGRRPQLDEPRRPGSDAPAGQIEETGPDAARRSIFRTRRALADFNALECAERNP